LASEPRSGGASRRRPPRARRAAAAALLVLACAGARAADITVVQRDRAYMPTDVTIARGDQVVFKNDDAIAHNVISKTPGQEFDLKLQKPGESKAIRFDKPGTVSVTCDIHPRMEMTVTVK
jgi:plastocyanin